MRQALISSGVALFGLALLTVLILVAYVGSHRPGLSPAAWLFVLGGAIHLVRGARRGEPLAGMRYAVLCAAIPFVMVTQAFITTVALFGGLAVVLLGVQLLISLLLRRHWQP